MEVENKDMHDITYKERRLVAGITAVTALGLLLLLLLVQAFVTAVAAGSAPTTPQTQPAAQVITPTVTFDEAMAAYIAGHTIQSPVGEPTYGAAWSGETMHISYPGETVSYMLVLSNTGSITDTFDITYTATWNTTPSTTTVTLLAGDGAEIEVNVSIPGSANNGDSDTAVVTATSQGQITTTATITLTTLVQDSIIYLPLITKPVPPPTGAPTLSATRPNSSNHWQMNWTLEGYPYLSGYQLQESQDASFDSGVTTTDLGTVNTKLIDTHQPSPDNVFYYRIRAYGGGQYGPWSNVVKVVGAYYDEFTNNQTGWSGPTLKESLRRLTFLEKIDAWYEQTDQVSWLILRVEDSWDWAIASPLKPAPILPYSIEFRSMPANLGNLVSHGVVFGGDWSGEPCPDWSTYLGVYAHTNCFNHFYTTNLIWYSDTNMRLLWERVDQLVWCPNCDGSPLKRLGDIDGNNIVELSINANSWNDYRVEVRQTDIKFYVNNNLRFTYDTDNHPNALAWINSPYFGVFASTDEYSNSTGRFEYIKVTPLDN
ncbi:MAG: hypothetical protein BroJett015_42030 [Chloroflexota bacterium]|nr:MAG: hypothetical protein BroJett015_42030 [Chloroflexota bacterium]